MNTKIVAIVGTYRKNGIIDQAVDVALDQAKQRGAAVEKIYLLDKYIEFCKNCRTCNQPDGPHRGPCIHRDDMDDILTRIDAANALILAAPVNFYNVNALTRRFIERLVCYAFWPWGQPAPKMRPNPKSKNALLITSTAMPAFLGRIFTGAVRALKITAKTLGAKPVASVFVGMIAADQHPTLPDSAATKIRRAANKLIP